MARLIIAQQKKGKLKTAMFNKHDTLRDACQLFYRKGRLIDRIHAENVGCKYC